jgi:hypothetical protein
MKHKAILTDGLSRGVFIASMSILAMGGSFLLGALAYHNDFPPFPQFELAYTTLQRLVRGDSHLSEHLQPTRNQGDGVTINARPDDGALVFISGFFDGENQARLMRREGTVVKKWSLHFPDHFSEKDTRACAVNSSLGVDVHGALVTPQGELVLNYEYCGTVKLDQCGAVMWRINKPTHHSLIPSMDGGYWLLGRQRWRSTEEPDRLPPFSSAAHRKQILDDTILRISDDGMILEETSIAEILRAGGLEALLTASGRSFNRGSSGRSELVHANKVAELTRGAAGAFPLFEAGDLAISLRKLNLILVIDPASKAVKWHQTGPWIRQHDPEFRKDGRISIFNNNTYRTAYSGEKVVLSSPFKTNIIAVDPVTRDTEILFGERPGQEMLSVVRGQHELLADGGMVITEFDAGRVLEVDAKGEIVWEYINRYDDDYVGEVINADIYPEGYFQSNWATCQQ